MNRDAIDSLRIPDGRQFYSLQEAAQMTGMSPDYLKGQIEAGLLRAVKTGKNGTGRYKFARADLDAWFAGLEVA